jgi:hypothetical protein
LVASKRPNHLAVRTALALVSQIRSTGKGSDRRNPWGEAGLAHEVVGARTVTHSCPKSLEFKVNAANHRNRRASLPSVSMMTTESFGGGATGRGSSCDGSTRRMPQPREHFPAPPQLPHNGAIRLREA